MTTPTIDRRKLVRVGGAIGLLVLFTYQIHHATQLRQVATFTPFAPGCRITTHGGQVVHPSNSSAIPLAAGDKVTADCFTADQ